MVMDHYRDKWTRPPYQPQPMVPPLYPDPYTIPTSPFDDDWPDVLPAPTPLKVEPPISQEELKEFRELLRKAKEYDKRNNEPDCELESKKQALIDIAKKLGVEINFE